MLDKDPAAGQLDEAPGINSVKGGPDCISRRHSSTSHPFKNEPMSG